MSTGKRVLIVDNDEAWRLSLAEQLRLHEEFLTDEAETGAASRVQGAIDRRGAVGGDVVYLIAMI